MQRLSEEELNTRSEIQKQKDIQIDRKMKCCVQSKARCKIALGLTDAEYDKLLAPIKDGGDERFQLCAGIPSSFNDVDARIDFNKCCPVNSTIMITSLYKLRLACESRLNVQYP